MGVCERAGTIEKYSPREAVSSICDTAKGTTRVTKVNSLFSSFCPVQLIRGNFFQEYCGGTEGTPFRVTENIIGLGGFSNKCSKRRSFLLTASRIWESLMTSY